MGTIGRRKTEMNGKYVECWGFKIKVFSLKSGVVIERIKVRIGRAHGIAWTILTNHIVRERQSSKELDFSGLFLEGLGILPKMENGVSRYIRKSSQYFRSIWNISYFNSRFFTSSVLRLRDSVGGVSPSSNNAWFVAAYYWGWSTETLTGYCRISVVIRGLLRKRMKIYTFKQSPVTRSFQI